MRSVLTPVLRLWHTLPKGHSLDDEAWSRRHRGIVWFVWAHAVGVPMFGVFIDRYVLLGSIGGMILTGLQLAQKQCSEPARGFCYNGDNNDDTISSYGGYGVNPPAVGIKWLNCSGINNMGVTSFIYCSSSQLDPYCERDPNGEPLAAYYMLKGLKKDQTPWVIPPGGDPQYITKFCYSGDPETGTGWNEGIPGSPSGSVENCGGPGSLTGTIHAVNPSGDRRMIMSSGSDNNNISPDDTIRVLIAQLIARGTNNLNSVTMLKQLSDVAQNLCNNGFVIGVNNISTEVLNSFKLYQNYPNPFNPVTMIRFDIPPSKGARGMNTKLIIYDILGREIATLVNNNLKPGTYEADWNASNYPSGVYFYKLITDSYSETKKMVLMK